MFHMFELWSCINLCMREEITKLRESGISYREIARIVGLSKNAVRQHIVGQPCKRRRKEPTPCVFCGKSINGTRVSSYCGPKCHADWEYTDYISRWKIGNATGNIGKDAEQISAHVRRYMFEKYCGVCCKCGWCQENKFTRKVPLQVNHIDGNSRNSQEENLELLCPNCHSLTPNYGSRNKGNGRTYRYNWKHTPTGDGNSLERSCTSTKRGLTGPTPVASANLSGEL